MSIWSLYTASDGPRRQKRDDNHRCLFLTLIYSLPEDFQELSCNGSYHVIANKHSQLYFNQLFFEVF